MNYAVISDNGPPPVPFSWQRMNLYGTTFNVRREREKAEAWIAAALMAGFTVYHSSRKGSSAPGRTYIKPA